MGWSLRFVVSRITALSVLLLLMGLPASAQAAVPFCTFGTGPDQCVDPAGVAIDTGLARVYVADRGNDRVKGDLGTDRINVFEEDGDFLFSFGSFGSGNGQFADPAGIAVDNDPTSPAFQDVYVVDRLPSGPGDTPRARVQRFDSTGAFVVSIGVDQLHSGNDPVAIGPGGTVLVADNFTEAGEPVRRIEKFTPAGISVGSSDLPGAATVQALVVDSAGDAYVSRFAGGELSVEKYELSEPDSDPARHF